MKFRSVVLAITCPLLHFGQVNSISLCMWGMLPKQEMRRCYALGTEDGNREACMLAQAAAPYCHPRLQAIMQQTNVEAGDTLAALLKAIDGTTTGIKGLSGPAGEPALEAEPPVSLPN
jgi:hypothetical protein